MPTSRRFLLVTLVALGAACLAITLLMRPATAPTAHEAAPAVTSSPATPVNTDTPAAPTPATAANQEESPALSTASRADEPPPLPAELAAVLSNLPDVPLRAQLQALPPAAQQRALRKLSRLPIPAEDYPSLRVTADGGLYYVNDIPPPDPDAAPALAASAAVPTAPTPETARATSSAAAVPIATPPAYHSRPGSTNVIYLDFNGHTVTGTSWNSGDGRAETYIGKPYDTDDDPTTFSDAEQADIRAVWERVAEDYAPWDIDVTTEEPAVFTSTTARALITASTDANGVNMPSSTAGGVAQLDVFGESDFATRSSPAFVYFDNLSNSSRNIAEAISHEIGHNFGLTHDGQPGVEYYTGHGSGDTSWGPIMGGAYIRNVTQFSKGEYFNANNSQDDFAQITSHIAYATDEAGSTTGTAAAASVIDSTVSVTGVTSHVDDIDMFAVSTSAGSISFAVTGYRAATATHGGNTDFKLELLDASGSVVASAAPAGDTNASLTYEAAAGEYFIRLSPDGDGTPLADPPTGYTAYGSAGQYTLTGTIIASEPGITSETTASVDAGALFSYTIVATNAPTAYSATGLPAGLTVDTETGEISGRATEVGTFNIALSATNSLGTGTASLSLTVNDAPPAITAQTTSRLVLAPGSDQTLSVTTLSANGTPSYQWERNGFEVAGATNSSLDLTSVTGLSSGVYRIRATNTIGTTLGDPIFVTVAPVATDTLVWGDDGQGMTTVPADLDDAIALSLGYEFAVALRRDGTLAAWGSDSSGQATAPTDVVDAVAIAAGSFHALALNADGTVTPWGSDFWDQSSPPAGLTDVMAIAAGGDASVALKNDGTVVAWGATTYGQTTVPDGLSDVVAIAAGNFHVLALKSDGTVVAWGDNSSGQTTVPAEATDIVEISAGREFSVARKSDGTLVTWGSESFNLTALPNDVAPFSAIEMGSYHGLALNAAGKIYTWGYNGDGQRLLPVDLGPVFAASASRSNTGALRNASLHHGPEITSQSATRQTFSAIGQTLSLSVEATGSGALSYQWYRNGQAIPLATAADYLKTGTTLPDAGVYWAAVTDDNGTRRSDPIHVLFAPPASEVIAWGLNDSGQTTVPSGLDNAIALAAGTTHALALKADGTVIAWGSNDDGESTVPAGLTDVVHIAAGTGVSYAVKSDGSVVVWGANNFGGGAPPFGLTGVIDLDIRTYHAIALRIDGTVVCWGNSGSGQTTVPADLAPAIDVAVGANTSYALHADGKITAWGYGGNGETTVPDHVTSIAIAGGRYHALALVDGGTIAGWGFQPLANFPGTSSVFYGVSAGEDLSVGLRSDRSVVAWGWTANANGERTVPAGLDAAFAISAGSEFALALQEAPSAPVMLTQPADLTVNAGGNATFSATATGIPAPSYQWRKDGQNIPNADSSSFSIFPVTTADAGAYDVVVTNSQGSVTSASATLTVNFAPIISVQPQSTAVASGTGVTLSVTATGLPTPTYQWRKNGTDIDGATTTSLDLGTVSPTDAAAYDVVITNSVGTTVSDTATLTVQVAPSISAQPESQTVNDGDTVTFSVTADGIPAPAYQWRKDGQNIADANAASYTIAATTPDDAGDYDVVVTNDLGSATSSAATLTVEYAPRFTTHPQSQTVSTGAEVTLTASATGVPSPLSFQWLKDTQPITGANAATLVIASVSLDDAGEYAVVAGNAKGSTRSDAAVLTVNAVPEITAQPATQTTALTGTDVTLTVTATGTPEPTYQWRKDGSDIIDATSASLAFTAITLGDAATYSVVVSNAAGEVTSADAVVSVIEINGTQSTDGYTAGESVTITNTVSYAGPITSLTWTVMPPAAIEGSPWSFVSTSGDIGGVVPTTGDIDVLDWSWSTLPASPFTFSYVLNAPAAAVGDHELTAQLTVNGSLLAMATPDPLTLTEPVTAHSADSNQDLTIDLSELLRVIELYNTRSGTQRTGAYAVDAQTEDGFTPDTSRAVDSPATLSAYHSADADQDSFISLSELLRVIELYNTRSGTTRTGQYHIDPTTEDGFAPGPAPGA